MKTTEKKSTVDLVSRLSKVIEARRSLDKEEQEIKVRLKATMYEMDTKVLAAGDYVMVISDRIRKDLDKDMVKLLLGNNYDDCIKESAYQIFEVKKA